jgi:hypothetical protein
MEDVGPYPTRNPFFLLQDLGDMMLIAAGFLVFHSLPFNERLRFYKRMGYLPQKGFHRDFLRCSPASATGSTWTSR